MGQITVQPSQTPQLNSIAAGQWNRAIPNAGCPFFSPPISPIGGAPTCGNLLAYIRPTPSELLEVVSYSIGWAVSLATVSTPPNITTELALIVNNVVRYSIQTTIPAGSFVQGSNDYIANGSFTSDLNNPIDVTWRDSLSLRFGYLSDQAAAQGGVAFVGIQQTPAGAPTDFQSTLTFNVETTDRDE